MRTTTTTTAANRPGAKTARCARCGGRFVCGPGGWKATPVVVIETERTCTRGDDVVEFYHPDCARPDEQQELSQRYSIQYPSGTRFTLQGQFELEELGQWLIPAIKQADGTIVALDQRAIVTKDDGVIVYTPSRNRDGLQANMTEWLNANPEWGR